MATPAQSGARRGPPAGALPWLLLVAAPLCWAGNFVVARYLHQQVSPVGFNLWRWVVALAALLPFTLPAVRRQWPLLWRHWRLVLGLAATGVVLFQCLLYLALQHTEVVNAALIVTTMPAVIVLFSWLFYRERIVPRQAVGIAVSLLGTTVLICRGDPSLLLGLELNRGDAWMLVAVPNWALYSVLLRRVPRAIEGPALLTATAGCGLLLLLPAWLWELAAGGQFQFNGQTVAGVVFVGLFASVIAYACWNYGVARVGPNRAGVFMHLVPVFSAVLAVTLLGERLHLFHVLGVTLVFTGIVLTTRRRRVAAAGA